jgi:GT2 family glycosyltransferase/glycosyltransferase involved in cell wall biosynthesis
MNLQKVDVPGAPIVSIILPTYNRESSLAKAINSVLAQSFQDWELIVSDDGSTDGTAHLVASHHELDARIVYLPGSRGGVSSARNRAMLVARGQIFCYLDSDNTWREQYLQAVYDQLAGKLRVSCYAALKAYILDDSGATVEELTLLNDFDAQRIRRRNQIDLNTFAHSRDLFDSKGGFDESLTRLVDWDLILRYSRVAPPSKIAEVSADYYHHRGEERVSISQNYALNRFRIALKNDLQDGCSVVLFGYDNEDALTASLAGMGVPVSISDKDEINNGWRPRLTDVVIWRWTDWDEFPGNLASAADILDYQCAVSFYVIEDVSRVECVAQHGIDGRFYYLVTDNPAQKTLLQQKISAGKKVKDINPIDRVLLWEGDQQEYSFAHYLELLHSAHFPDNRGLSIAVGVQPLTTENPLEWGDYQYAQSFIRGMERHGFTADILCRDEWVSRLPDYEVLIHIYGIHHPPMPPVKGQLRCLWLLSHVDRFEPIKAAGYHIIFVASRKYAEHLSRLAPGLRVEYLPQATDTGVFRPLEPEGSMELAFVGNSRGTQRLAVDYAVGSGKNFSIWGRGWEDRVPPESWQSGLLNSNEVASVYGQAEVVINDHWKDQAKWELVNNRVFDVLACGKIPVSDENGGLKELFPFVPTFNGQSGFDSAVAEAKALSASMGAASIRSTVVNQHSFYHRARHILSRIGQLTSLSASGLYREFEKPRVLYLTGNPSANSTRKRAIEVLDSLSLELEVRSVEHKRATIYHMLGADIIVIQRWTDQSLERAPAVFDAIAQLRPLGKQFIYEIDDLLFHQGGALPVRFIKSCDAVITSTNHLREHARNFSGNVYLLPNAIKVEDIKFSPGQQDHDLPQVLSVSTDALGFERFESVARHFDGQAEFIFVSLAKVVSTAENLTVLPAMPVSQLNALLAGVDMVVNDCSMPTALATKLEMDSDKEKRLDFLNCKSPIKYFYAGLAGKPFVSTSQPESYLDVVADGTTGFFADSFEEQIAVIERLIASPELCVSVGQAAHKDVIRRHTLLAMNRQYLQLFCDLNKIRLNGVGEAIGYYHQLNDISDEALGDEAQVVFASQLSALKNALEAYRKLSSPAKEDTAHLKVSPDWQEPSRWSLMQVRFRTRWIAIKHRTLLMLTGVARMHPAVEAIARKLWRVYRRVKDSVR